MTELVIRIDPARMAQAAHAYAERTWRTVREQLVLPQIMPADCTTHVKIAIVAAAAVSIILIYSVSRAITATPLHPTLKQRLDEAHADTKSKVRVVEIVRLDPKPVKTERVLPLPPMPAIEVPDELPPLPPTPPTRKRYAAAVVAPPVEHNICTRHNLRKVIINGGKSWRCRR